MQQQYKGLIHHCVGLFGVPLDNGYGFVFNWKETKKRKKNWELKRGAGIVCLKHVCFSINASRLEDLDLPEDL